MIFTTSEDLLKGHVKNMRKTVAEQVRAVSPGLAEALEEGLFSDQEIADELRGRAYDFERVSEEFFQCLICAAAVENLGGEDD